MPIYFPVLPGAAKTLALLFAQALNCHNKLKRPCGQCLSCRRIASGNHPDLYILKPQGSSLKIGQLREVKDSLYLLSVAGGKKSVLFMMQSL